MSEPPEYETKARLLREIGQFLYGVAPTRAAIPLDDLYCALPNEPTFNVDAALKKMEANDLLGIELKGPTVRAVAYGKSCHELDCIPQVVLGRDYIYKKFSDAGVHLIVTDANSDEAGGTGYFCADFPNQIITAAHVLADRTVTGILDHSGNHIPLVGNLTGYGDSSLDLGALECQMPANINPIRVEWGTSDVGASLTVMGYPQIALHTPVFTIRLRSCILSQRNIHPHGSHSLFQAPLTQAAVAVLYLIAAVLR